ncbi:MAG: hypothetical protein K0R46_3088 [Herbinix sp.]|nr:hypothetical protein [Herbinix sp.]
MKLKDKKINRLIYRITLAIGLLALVLNPIGYVIPKSFSRDSAEAVNLKSNLEMDVVDQEAEGTITSMSTEPTPSPIPTISPTPTPLPVYSLENNDYPKEIEKLVKTYYEAKVNCDIDTLKSISSEPSNVISEKKLLSLMEGIDEYKNIKCYVKKSYEEGAYIVFVSYEIKFIGLDTLAPSLSKLYIITDEAGELKNYDGDLSEELRAYITSRSDDLDVEVLRKHTEESAKQAKADDKKLKEYWEALDNR